jgi:hypothetical protein
MIVMTGEFFMADIVYRKISVIANRRIYPISEVARRSGWPDPNFFARTFRAQEVAAAPRPRLSGVRRLHRAATERRLRL